MTVTMVLICDVIVRLLFLIIAALGFKVAWEFGFWSNYRSLGISRYLANFFAILGAYAFLVFLSGGVSLLAGDFPHANYYVYKMLFVRATGTVPIIILLWKLHSYIMRSQTGRTVRCGNGKNCD